MLGNKALNINHREDEGFYVGWNIYLWNTKIPLNNSLVSDITASTVIIFTNPLDITDTLELSLGTGTSTTTPNILTLANNTEKNLDGYKVAIKGFPSGTTITSHDSVNNVNLSHAVSSGVLPDNTRLVMEKTGEHTEYYTASSYDNSTKKVTL